MNRRALRLRAIARQIIRHQYSAHEVARALATTALEYAERDMGEAAAALGLPPEAVARCAQMTHAAEAVERGAAEAGSDWEPGPAAWPDGVSHD